MLEIINKSYSDGNLKLEFKFSKQTDLDIYLGKSIKYYINYGTFIKKNKGIDNYKLIKGGNLVIKGSKIEINIYIGDLKGEYVGKDIDIGYELIITSFLVDTDLYNAMIPIGYTHMYELRNVDLYNNISDDISYSKVWNDIPTGFKMLFIGLILWGIPLLIDFQNSGLYGIIMFLGAYLIYYIYSSGGYDIFVNIDKIKNDNVYLNDLIKFKSTKVITGARLEISLLNKEGYLFSRKDSNGRDIDDTTIKIVNRKKIVDIKMDNISQTEDFYGYLNRYKFDLNKNLKEVIPNIYYNQHTLSGSILDIEVKFISDEYRDFIYVHTLNDINDNFYFKYILKDKFKDIIKNIKLDKETEEKLIIEDKDTEGKIIIEDKSANLIKDIIKKEEKDIIPSFNNSIKIEKINFDINNKTKIDIDGKNDIDNICKKDVIKTKNIIDYNELEKLNGSDNSFDKSLNNNILDLNTKSVEFKSTFGKSNNSFNGSKTFSLDKTEYSKNENKTIDTKITNTKEEDKTIDSKNSSFSNNNGMFKKSTLFDK